jgi:hypothetical protein
MMKTKAPGAVRTGGTTMSDEGNKQRVCGMLVAREVLVCCSPLVYSLLQSPSAARELDVHEGELFELASNVDYEQAARDWVRDAGPGELETAFGWDIVDEDPDGDAMESLRRKADDQLDEYSPSDFQRFCSDNSVSMDDYVREAYEHWIVTSWFADKLKEKGEIVGELLNWHIWGRCTTGQAILLDSVIEQIASDMEILPGQKNDWSKEK